MKKLLLFLFLIPVYLFSIWALPVRATETCGECNPIQCTGWPGEICEPGEVGCQSNERCVCDDCPDCDSLGGKCIVVAEEGENCYYDYECAGGYICEPLHSGTPDNPGGTCIAGTRGPTPTPGCIDTALGCIPTDVKGLAEWFLKLAAGISGAIAVILIIIGGLQIMTSQGDPKAVQEGKERITAAIVGLLFVLFSVIILHILGVKILGFKIF